jgi:hypothetical protein
VAEQKAPCDSIASRSTSSCASRAARIASASDSHRRVDPSISVNVHASGRGRRSGSLARVGGAGHLLTGKWRAVWLRIESTLDVLLDHPSCDETVGQRNPFRIPTGRCSRKLPCQGVLCKRLGCGRACRSRVRRRFTQRISLRSLDRIC